MAYMNDGVGSLVPFLLILLNGTKVPAPGLINGAKVLTPMKMVGEQ